MHFSSPPKKKFVQQEETEEGIQEKEPAALRCAYELLGWLVGWLLRLVRMGWVKSDWRYPAGLPPTYKLLPLPYLLVVGLGLIWTSGILRIPYQTTQLHICLQKKKKNFELALLA